MNTTNLNHSFQQNTAFMQANNKNIRSITVRVRCVLHDAGLLFVSVVNNSLDANNSTGKAQNELYFWKRTPRGISNV